MARDGVKINAPIPPGCDEILTPQAIDFVVDLHRRFESRRNDLLNRRIQRQHAIDAGQLPEFLSETAEIRNSSYVVGPIPADLMDRRVEITGPVDRKMVINALNSGANVFMAYFEDSNSPTWENNLNGQVNMRDAVRGDIEYTSAEGKQYKLNAKTAVLMVRPRGWHLLERHFHVDGQPISGSLFDFGLYFFHNARTRIAKGTAPYFYLPKLQSHLEARLWNDVFVYSQQALGVPNRTIRATVLIETLLAAFEMDEILFELRDHCAGLNCGRWDYIFSFIKTFRNHPKFMMPDRVTVTMDKHFLKSYVDLLIQTCHRREIHAMGGMAAQIPIKNDPAANAAAMEKVRQDKIREVKAGHDGTWVAHPGLVAVAKQIFDEYMQTPNQIHLKREHVRVTAADLINVPEGQITDQGLRTNVDIGIQYLESWLRGNGCVPIYNLMEDAATAEISRTQVWQWMHHGAILSNGQKMSAPMIRDTIKTQLAQIRANIGDERYDKSKFPQAALLFEHMMVSGECKDFLTLEAYRYL